MTAGSRWKIVLFILITTNIVSAEDEWHYSFEQAKKAIAAKDWAKAESQLLLAEKNGPPPARNQLAYGTYYIKPWIPDYYLGIVYLNQGKKDQALARFEKAEKSGILKSPDREYVDLQQKIASLRPPPGPTPAEEAKTLLAEAENAINKRQLRNARKLVESALKKDPSNPKINTLLTKIIQIEETDQQAITQLTAQGRIDEARTLLGLIVQSDPSHPKINEMGDAIAAKENQYRELLKASTEPEIQNALKVLQDLSIKNPNNKLYADLMNQMKQKEGALIAASNEKARQQKSVEFTDLMRKANQAYAAKNYSLARELAQKAKATGVDEKKEAQKLVELIAATEFNEFMGKAREAYNAKNFAEARTFAIRADQTGADKAGTAKSLLKKLELDENLAIFAQAQIQNNVERAQQAYTVVSRMDPEHPKLKSMISWIRESGAKLNLKQREQLAIVYFYSGDYENAKSLLDTVESEKAISAKMYFYLGCTNAAIALMKNKEERKSLLNKATAYFAKVRSLDPKFNYFDESSISPRIIGLYIQSH